MIGKKIVIGITGTISSGKGLAAQILKDKGFSVATVSSVIREELKERGIEPARKALQDIGNQMRQEHGGEYWVARILSKNRNYDTPLVIDGIRNLAEINYLKVNSDFHLIGVDAPFEVRWQRVQQRNRDSDLLNHDRFVIDDARDRGFNEPLNGQQVGMCLVHSDFLINNDEEFTRLEDSKLYKEINEIYRKIKK